MRLWPRTHGSLWIAAILYGLGILIITGSATINRLGPEHGRLNLDDCRLIVEDPPGLLATLLIGGDGVRLAVEENISQSAYARSLAERLGSGPLVQTPDVVARPPLAAYVVLDASQKSTATDSASSSDQLLLIDGARRMKHLTDRYSLEQGMAIARGYFQPTATGKEAEHMLRLAIERPTLPKGARYSLKHLPIADSEKNGETTCQARFLLDIRYGALGHPWVAGLRPLSGPIL